MNLRRLTMLAAGFLLAAMCARAAVPAFEWSVDSQQPAATWVVKTFAGATPLFRVTLKEGGTNWTPSADWSGIFWYGTNTDWNATGIVQVAGQFTNAHAWVDFQAASNTFPTAGSYYGGIVMTNATQAMEMGRGYVIVNSSGGLTATGILDLRGNAFSVTGGLLTLTGNVLGLSTAAVVTAANGVTNRGCTVDGQYVTNGAVITTASAGVTGATVTQIVHNVTDAGFLAVTNVMDSATNRLRSLESGVLALTNATDSATNRIRSLESGVLALTNAQSFAITTNAAGRLSPAGTTTVQAVVGPVMATGSVAYATRAGTAASATNVVGTLQITNATISVTDAADYNMGMETAGSAIGNAQTQSVWFGYKASYLSSGEGNSALGYFALKGSSGNKNTGLGHSSVRQFAGDDNTGAGYASLFNASGSSNAGFGAYSLWMSAGFFNTALGHSALLASAGSGNSALGEYAGAVAPGSYNTAVGKRSGYQSPGTSNVFVGAHAGMSGASTYFTNAIAIGAGAVPLGDNSMVLGNADTTNTQIKGNITVSNLTVTAGGNVLTNGGRVATIATNMLSWGFVDPAPTSDVQNVQWTPYFAATGTVRGIRSKAFSGTVICDVIKQNWTNAISSYTTIYTGATFNTSASNIPFTAAITVGDMWGVISTNVTTATNWWFSLEWTP